jgi:ABC-2 type transport system permease protein
MNRLFKIELIKIRSNASFWVLASLHIGIIMLVLLSGKVFIKTLNIDGQSLTNMVNLSSIPIYQFPDVWHNFTYIAAYLKFILAIYVIISITGEIGYDTLRLNIMNGLSRGEFIVSKMFMILLLSFFSTMFLFIVGLTVGLTSTPDLQLHYIIKYSGFVPAYFLELTAYLIFALLIGLLIKRTGLAMGLLFLYTLIIEPVILLNIHTDWIKGLFPNKAINNLIHMPFGKYLLREVQDYVAFKEIAIVVVYIALFTWLIYLLLRKRDLK